jgi:hypothetical protein
MRHTREPFNWTDEACDLLRARWAEGASASEVARELGGTLSRSAVCGKAMRLGLSHTRTEHVRMLNIRRMSAGPKTPRQAKPKAAPKPRYVNVRNVVHNIEARKRDPGPRALPKAERTFPLARPWITRNFGECAFPIGEGGDLLSCCAPTERNYCMECEAVMFNPVQPTMKRTLRMSRMAA